ncbi:hornerin-like [Macrobrachium nipponense]|uniref:hornerin-like n=1 Tax=Macrobrachium nipponense TaxID=159736 RepID=UPI0030C88230
MMWTKVVLAAMVFGIASSSPRVRRDTPEDAGIPPSGDAVSRFRAGEGGNAKTPGIPLPRKLADVNLRRGRADVSLRGEISVRPLRGGHADVSPTRGQDDLSIQGGHADASPRRGHAGVSLRGRLAGVSPRREHADVSPTRGQDDLSISEGHADVSLTEGQNDLGTSGGNADVSLRRGQNDLGHRRGHADVSLSRGQDDLGLKRGHAVSLSRGQDDLSHSGGHQPITLHESQAGVTSSRGASATPSSTLSSSSGSSEKINSFGSTTESESRDHSRTLAQFSFQGARATPIVVGVSHEPLLDLSSSVAIKFGGTEDSVIFGTNGFGETSSSPTSTSAGGSHRFSSRRRHSESRFTITDQPTSFSARNLKDGTASDRGVGPATFFKENSGSVSTSASLAEPIEFGSEGSFPSTSGRESSPAVSLKVATDSSGSNRLRGHFTHGEKTSPVLEDQEELRSILHRGTGAEFAATNSGGIGSLFDRGSSVAQTKDTPGRSIATSASSSAGSFGGFSLKGLRGVSATSQGSVSERLPVESSSVSPTLAATGRVGRLSIGDFNSGNTGKISTGGSSVTSISVHKSGSNIFSAEGSDIISASNNQENVKDVSNTFNVASTSTATDGLRISSGDSNAVANSRGRISNRDSQAVTNSRGRISNGNSQAVTNSRARISNRDSQALTNSRGRISNRDSQAVTNSRGRISNRDSQAVATVRGNGGGTFINTESDAASTLIGNRQLSSHSFRKLGTISASTDRGKPNRLSVEDSDLSNSARRLGGLLAGSSGLSTGSGSARISAGQSTVASTSSRGGSFGSFSGSTSSSGSGAEEVLKTNDDSVTIVGNALNRLPAKNAKTISASRRFPIRSTTASVGESGGFSKRGPGSTATFSNDLSPGGLFVRNSGSKTTVEGHSQAPPNTQIFSTHTDAADSSSKNSDTAGGFSFKGLRDATASSQGSVSESLSDTGRVGKLSAGDFIADSELANSGEIGKISINHSGTTSVSDHDSGLGKFSIRGSDVTFGSANQERIIDLSTGSNLASTSTVSDGLRFSNGGSLAAATTSTGIGGISFVDIKTDASHASLGNEGLGSFSLGRLGTTTALSDTGKFSRLSAKGFGNSEGFRGLSAGSSGQPPEPAGGRSVEISARESTAASSIQDGSLGRFSVSSSRSTSGTENDLKNNLAFNSVVGDASKGSTSSNAGSFSTQGSTADSGGQFGVFSRRGPGVRAPFNSDLSLGGLSVGTPTSQSSVEGPSKGSPNIPIVITHSEAFDGNDKISAGSNAGERQPSVSSHLKGPFSLSKAIDTGTIIATTPNSEFTSTGELASENASGLGENVVARPSTLSNSFGDVTIKHARQGLSSTSGSSLSGTLDLAYF